MGQKTFHGTSISLLIHPRRETFHLKIVDLNEIYVSIRYSLPHPHLPGVFENNDCVRLIYIKGNDIMQLGGPSQGGCDG
jgi:hypothetical protein